MLDSWMFIGIFVLLAAVFPAAPILLSHFLGPKKPNPIKQDTYECGIETVGETWVQFKVQYYVYALVFLIFDVEIIFLYPWAVAFRDLGWAGFVQLLSFFTILSFGYVYVWRKGVLDWGPVARVRRQTQRPAA